MFFYKLNMVFRKIVIIVFLKIKNYNASKTIIIFSEARGGSTWLMEMLNDALKVSINWEPLHKDQGVVPKTFNFGWRPYIPLDDKNETYKKLFKNINEYRHYTNWTLSRLKLSKLIKSKQVLVKYVRANMLIPYLLKNFKFKHAPILLLRHPIDSCLSHMKAFNKDRKSDEEFKVPEGINNERFSKHIEYINQLQTELERVIAIWCLNNCYTLNQLNSLKGLHIIYYSDLLNDPEIQIRNYLVENQLEKHVKTLEKVNFRKISSTDFNSEFNNNLEEQLFKNFKRLDEDSKKNIQKVFDYFEFKLFTAFSPYPIKD